MPYAWEDATISEYKELPDQTGWLACKKCGSIPRIWVFDNGNYAKCRCSSKYEDSISAISIIDHCHHAKLPYSEYKTKLMEAWNKHVNKQVTP